MTIPERLDGLMNTHGIKNRAELARLSGIPYTTIDGVYKKGPENLTLKTLSRLSAYFNCTIDYLATGIENDQDDPLLLDLMDAAKGNDPEDIRRAADQLRKTKELKARYDRMRAYAERLEKR